MQYLHYIKGPELLDLRKEEDPYRDLKISIEKEVGKVGLEVAADALALLYKEALSKEDQGCKKLVEILKDVIRRLFEDANPNDFEYWNEIEADGWGHVDHGYWFRPFGFAVQLHENFTSEHVVRAIEFFPNRGEDYSKRIKDGLEEIRRMHPFFPYQWNGRTVYKFPVTTRKEAENVCKALYALIESDLAAIEEIQRTIINLVTDNLKNNVFCELEDGGCIEKGKVDADTGYGFKLMGTDRKIRLSAEKANGESVYVGIYLQDEKNASERKKLEKLLTTKLRYCEDTVEKDKWTWNRGWWFYKHLPEGFKDWNAAFYQECISNEQKMKDCQKCIYELILELANVIREEGRMEDAK